MHITPMTMALWFVGNIYIYTSIVDGVYKPISNLGAPHCRKVNSITKVVVDPTSLSNFQG